MTYSVWDGASSPPNNNPGRSAVGIKLATSNDGITWTKTGTVLVPLGASGAYDDNNIEGGQFLKVGGKWIILYNANRSGIWYVMLAYSDEIDAVFTKRSEPYFRASTGTQWDNLVVAVPMLQEFPAHRVMYYQALGTGSSAINIGAANITVNPI